MALEDDNAKLFSNIRGASRVQAASGSLGTTTGDNSGTGVNTNQRKRKPTKGFGRLGDKFRDDPQRQLSDFRERLRRDVSGGRISVRAAEGLINDRAIALAGDVETRRKTETTAETSTAQRLADVERFGQEQAATLRRTDLDRAAETRRADLKRESLSITSELDRAQRESADVRRDVQLGTQFGITQESQRQQAERDTLQGQLALERLGIAGETLAETTRANIAREAAGTESAIAEAKQQTIANKLEAAKLGLGVGKAAVTAGDPTKFFEDPAAAQRSLTLGRSIFQELGQKSTGNAKVDYGSLTGPERIKLHPQIAALPASERSQYTNQMSGPEYTAFLRLLQNQ